MWLTVLVMALAVSIEPFRLGMTALLLTRPRPVADLAAFLCGGFLMGMAVGGAVLFGLHSTGLHNTMGSGRITLPKVQIGLGLLALLFAAALASGVRLPSRRAAEPGAPATHWSLADRAKRMVGNRSPWTTGIVGLAVALPSTDYLAVLAVILASTTSALTQFLALIWFNVLALAVVEGTLLTHLIAPQWTQSRVAALNDWVAAHRRHALTVTLAALGSVLLAVGLATV